MTGRIIFGYIWAVCMIDLVAGMKCKREFFYHQRYGYGYSIVCEELDKESVGELTSTSVYNEIKLVIRSSNLTADDWNLFGKLAKLREVSIVNSTLGYENQPLFKELGRLNYLAIENDNITAVFSNTFNELTNLRELSLSNNSLTRIESRAFDKLVHLTSLNLSRNRFRNMLDIPLCEPENLRILHLQHNDFDELPQNLTCLSQLEELYLDYNAVEILGNFLLTLGSLNTLSVSYNRIESLDDLLSNLTELRHLNLEGNRLSALHAANFGQLERLERINLKNNRIVVVSEEVFSANFRLIEINVEDNAMLRINLGGLAELVNAVVAKNRIDSLRQFSNSTGLRFLDLAHNNITEIQGGIFENFTSLRCLNLSFNDVGDDLFQDSFVGLQSLLELRLSSNGITGFDGGVFVTLGRLEVLDLSGNKISKLSNESFASLSSLQVLNMSNNRLENLEHDVFRKLMFLNVLDVGGNLLRNVEYGLIISELPSLRAINIRENLLSCAFLSEMISYLKSSKISYTIYEEFRYDRENVAGIYCVETESKVKDSLVVLENNSEILKALLNITTHDKDRYERKLNETIAFVVIFVALTFVLLSVASYRIYLYYRKRASYMDELELMQRHE